ncbi:hypothetical protein [Micromonospora tulbaghiae]|uniref:hypothetical protein n=1 Tax=Micromonospora tulbaghiae TaxID=479978 RepID=UPI003EBDDA6C
MRWPRQLMSLLVVLALLAAPPMVLLSLVGPPTPGWPTVQQVRAWVQEPLTAQTLTAALTIGAWLVWLVLASTVTVRVLSRVRATAARVRHMPLPTPLQATASGIAGAAVLGVTTHTVTTPPPQPPFPVAAGTLDDPGYATTTDPEDRVLSDDGIVVPGGWLPREVAEQVAAAAALVWLRRRRAYQPRPPGAHGRDGQDLAPLPTTVAAVQAALADHRSPPADLPDPAAAPAPPGGFPGLIGALAATGMGLTGPGGSAVGRGLLVTVLLAGQRHPTVSLVITKAALTRLLGPTAGTLGRRLPQLTVVDSADEAARLAESSGHAHRTGDEAERRRAPAVVTARSTVVLLAEDDCAAHDLTRWADAMAAGASTVVVLGRWPTGPTWHADPTGHLNDPRHPDRPGPRLCVLDQIAAIDLLTVIAHPEPTPPNAAPPSSSLHPAVAPRRRLPRQPNRHEPRLPPAASGRRLQLRVLGEPTLAVDGVPLAIRRSAAVQILVFLATHPDGADTPQLTDAMWPGLPRHSLTGRLYTTLSELRGTIRTACGLNVIDHAEDRYRLNPAHIDVDLWRLHAAVRHAATAVANTTSAWQSVVDAYPAELAVGRTWPWLDPIRESTRRHVIDAYAALAAAAPDPHDALTLLQASIRIDPYNTDLHTRARAALTALGDHHAASELRASHSRRLTEAGLHPDNDDGTAATSMSDATTSR